MLDPERKQSIFTSRANYQLREIQHTCRQVVSMAKLLNTFSNEISSSQVNCKKIQFFKTEIKDKLKEFVSSIDEIYKILDRKIQLIMAELKKLQSNSDKSKNGNICNKCSTRSIKGQQQYQTLINNDNQRIFSDTLNPRVAQLQLKINQYQSNEAKLKNKIIQLSTKNHALLQEFNRLSTASNKKINQLTSKISQQSFSSDFQNFNQSPAKSVRDLQIPTFSNTLNKPKKSSNYNFQTDQFSYQLSNEATFISNPNIIEEKQNFLSFGCMPSRPSKMTNNSLGRSNVGEQYDRLDRNDKNRRFDLLLNKLRDSQQESTDESHSEQMRVTNEQIGSVFSQNIVQRYQI